MSLTSEGQRLSANEMSLTYLNSWLRYNYFSFEKTNVRHIRILLPNSISVILYYRKWHAILHQTDEFYRNETTYCGNMTTYLDSRLPYNYFRF